MQANETGRLILTDRRLADVLKDWKCAWINFNMAEPDQVDAAIYDLFAAELRLNAEIRRARESEKYGQKKD